MRIKAVPAASGAGSELKHSAAVNSNEIVTEHMRPRVLAAVEVIRKHANTIPMGMDDSAAFRSPKPIQDAWREVADAIDTIQRAIQLRERMNQVGLDDIMPGTLEHLLIPTESFGDVEFHPHTPMIDRLLTYAKIGTTFVFATTSEIAAAQQKQAAERKATNGKLGYQT